MLTKADFAIFFKFKMENQRVYEMMCNDTLPEMMCNETVLEMVCGDALPDETHLCGIGPVQEYD